MYEKIALWPSPVEGDFQPFLEISLLDPPADRPAGLVLVCPGGGYHFRAEYDVTGSICKRYRRQDEIGTPYCVTLDFDTENDNAVTVRERDSMKRERIGIDNLRTYLETAIGI